MIDWIMNNKEWFLSGLGVFILGCLITLFRKLFKRPEEASSHDEKKYEQSVGKGLKAKTAQFNNINQEMNIGINKNDE